MIDIIVVVLIFSVILIEKHKLNKRIDALEEIVSRNSLDVSIHKEHIKENGVSINDNHSMITMIIKKEHL